MIFPYTEVRPGVFRPLVPLWIYGPTRTLLTDGVLDTGAERVLLLPPVARRLGIDIAALSSTVVLHVPTGQAVACKTAVLIVELRRPHSSMFWRSEVAIPAQPIRHCYWGIKGFLEFFRAEFDGPNHAVTLIAGSNLPVAAPHP
jgi:hypothetical protein